MGMRGHGLRLRVRGITLIRRGRCGRIGRRLSVIFHSSRVRFGARCRLGKTFRGRGVSVGTSDQRPVLYDSQYEMRFGPRAYTEAQARLMEQQVRERQPLAEPPLPIDD